MTRLDASARSIDPTFHHPSHRHLLAKLSEQRISSAGINALIVPTARPVDCLKNALTLAEKLGTGVVAMCSGNVTAHQAARLGDSEGVPVVAMNVTEDSYGLPTFSTTEMLNGTDFARPSDTSRKRNLALFLSRLAGWERVLFLDDDIYDVHPADAQVAAGLLDEFGVVGLNNDGYPDNSVTCHVLRLLGPDPHDPGVVPGEQTQFIGVGGMAVSPISNRSFFPDIYNQDWFFILGTGDKLRIAVTGLMKQKRYDPFEDPDRARREEFGDCLAEGLFWLLDNGRPIQHADMAHWRSFLYRRELFLSYLRSRVTEREFDQAATERIQACLARSRETLGKIKAEFCAAYVEHWQTDLRAWKLFLEERPVSLNGGLGAALEYVRWDGVATSSVPWPTSLQW